MGTMEMPGEDVTQNDVPSEVIKPVPRPFSIEALMSDTGPKRTSNTGIWNSCDFRNYQHQISKDTDSEGSLDLDLAQDLSRHSQKDGKFACFLFKRSSFSCSSTAIYIVNILPRYNYTGVIIV